MAALLGDSCPNSSASRSSRLILSEIISLIAHSRASPEYHGTPRSASIYCLPGNCRAPLLNIIADKDLSAILHETRSMRVTAQIQEGGDSGRLSNYENSKLKKKERESGSLHDFG